MEILRLAVSGLKVDCTPSNARRVTTRNLECGDHIAVGPVPKQGEPMPPLHHGIYLGEMNYGDEIAEYVMDMNGESKENAFVDVRKYFDFVGDRSLLLKIDYDGESVPGSKELTVLIAWAVKTLCPKGKYDFYCAIDNNCECFPVFCKTLRYVSQPFQAVIHKYKLMIDALNNLHHNTILPRRLFK